MFKRLFAVIEIIDRFGKRFPLAGGLCGFYGRLEGSKPFAAEIIVICNLADYSILLGAVEFFESRRSLCMNRSAIRFRHGVVESAPDQTVLKSVEISYGALLFFQKPS